MVRTFATHRIRKTQELSSCLWDFETLPEEGGTVGETAGGKETAPDVYKRQPMQSWELKQKKH